MTQVAPCFTYAGTELERAGRSPLLAVARYAPDGRLAEAIVADPAAGPFRFRGETEPATDGVAWIEPYGGAG
jgi:hypothetical protein